VCVCVCVGGGDQTIGKVKLFLCLTKLLHMFLVSELGGGKWSSSYSGYFTPGEGAGLDAMKKRNIPAPAGNQTLVFQPTAQSLC
jgi:hypothetical protein